MTYDSGPYPTIVLAAMVTIYSVLAINDDIVINMSDVSNILSLPVIVTLYIMMTPFCSSICGGVHDRDIVVCVVPVTITFCGEPLGTIY